ncbi:MAG: glycosyltransferase family 4 protein [Caldicoprobacter oshimai]|nr:MAG: glycosyltransferase family 4 protein [Caldicoprobacter oshimai]
MKVLVLSHMYPSSFNFLAGIFVHEQVKELIKQGCEVKVVSPVPLSFFPLNRMSNKWYRYSQIPHKEVRDGVEVYYPRYVAFPKDLFFASSGLRMYWGIKKLVHQIYEDFRFDVIHAHVALPDGYAAMLLSQELKKPFIVTIHGQDLQHTIYKNQGCRRSVEKVFKSANMIITVSGKLKRIGETEIGFPDKIRVINNGINKKKIEGIALLARDTSNRRDEKIILSVSNLIKTKGIDFNLHALSRLLPKYPDVKYLVIGDGPEKESLLNLSKELGIDEHVEFMGKRPNDEVIKYMYNADIFSLPSWSEGFGIVYLEAMACGKPVIACQGEGIEDVIQHGETGFLVRPKDVDSLVEVLELLLDNPQRALDVGKKAQKHVMKNYTWEEVALKIVSVYQEVVGW